MDDQVFRANMDAVFSCIERSLESADPDVVECEQSSGAMTIRLGDGSICILSAQPSLKQLWLAVAALGVGLHFDFDAHARKWMDDKGHGIELVQYLGGYLRKATGLDLIFDSNLK